VHVRRCRDASGKFTNYSSNQEGAGPKVSTGTATATYTVNSDGTGKINFTSPDTVTFAFTIDSTATSAQRLELILRFFLHPRAYRKENRTRKRRKRPPALPRATPTSFLVSEVARSKIAANLGAADRPFLGPLRVRPWGAK